MSGLDDLFPSWDSLNAGTWVSNMALPESEGESWFENFGDLGQSTMDFIESGWERLLTHGDYLLGEALGYAGSDAGAAGSVTGYPEAVPPDASTPQESFYGLFTPRNAAMGLGVVLLIGAVAYMATKK